MTFLIIILLVALVLVAWRRQLSPSPILNAVLIVLAVACLGAAVLMWRRPTQEVAHQIALVDRVQEAIGFELGRAVAQAIPRGGDVLVVLEGLPASFPTDGINAVRVKGLRAGFGRDNLHAVPLGYTPASADEAMEIQADWPRRGVPFEKIEELFEAHRGAVAVVAFTIVGSGPRGRLPTQIPPFFGLGPLMMENWLDWVRPGAVEAVVLGRSGLNWATAAAPSSSPDVFKNCCELITPANIAEVRSRMEGGTQ